MAETLKAPVSYRDIERRVQARARVDLSYPSTESPIQDLAKRFIDAAIEAENRIDYSGGRLDWIEPWMLDPSDSYPFVEWDDLSMRERAWVLTKRCAWAIERLKTPLEQTDLADLTFDLEAFPDKYDDQWECTEKAGERLRKAIMASDERRKMAGRDNPQPARTGHLMAEGGVLARVRAQLKDGSAYERKVSFSEPVNAYTMLHGDTIARGGDMLTACTTRDTQEVQIKDSFGKPKTIYTSKAVSI